MSAEEAMSSPIASYGSDDHSQSAGSVLAVVIEKELIEQNVSCTGNLIQLGLKPTGLLADVVDVDVRGWGRRVMIGRNFSPNMAKWRLKFHLDTKMRALRSSRASTLIHGSRNLKAVLQIGSEFDLSRVRQIEGIPRFSYHDSNLRAYLRGAWRLPDAKRSIAAALAYEQRVYGALSGILTMTEYLRNIFVEECRVPEGKVHAVGVGVNFSELSVQERDDDGRTILFVARHLFEQKGGLVTLAAFKKVRSRFRDARLLLVGQDLNIDQPGVECIPFIDKTRFEGSQRLSRLYATAAIFVLPSYYDALGNVFLEAMAHGTPCIGADCCAMPELVVANRAGQVIPPGDSDKLAEVMIELLSDDQRRAEYSQNGRRAIATKYNWPSVTTRAIAAMGLA